MRILIVFGSTEGHTEDLASFMAGVLGSAGHEVFTIPAGGMAEGLSLIGWHGIIVAGSLHAGSYQAGLVEFVRTHREALARVPTAFVSVSLSAAGKDSGDWEGLRRCVAEFEENTSWTPDAVHHAAGALRFSRYGLIKRLIFRWIARQRGVPEAGRDCDFTDYEALRKFVLEFTERAAARAREVSPVAASPGRTDGASLPEQVWAGEA